MLSYSSIISTLFSFANLHQSSNPSGGLLWYLRWYSKTASSRVLLCRDSFSRKAFSASAISPGIGCSLIVGRELDHPNER